MTREVVAALQAAAANRKAYQDAIRELSTALAQERDAEARLKAYQPQNGLKTPSTGTGNGGQ